MAISGGTSSTRLPSTIITVTDPTGRCAFSWARGDDTDRFAQAWIFDVDGVRLVIDAYAPKASDTVKAEFQRIVESIHIGP